MKARAQATEGEEAIARALESVASAIMPGGGGTAPCPSGCGYVASAGEAPMGVTAGLMAVSRALEEIADAIRETHQADSDGKAR